MGFWNVIWSLFTGVPVACYDEKPGACVLGNPCSETIQCAAPNMCINGKCKHPGGAGNEGDACREHAQCASPLQCDLIAGKCRAPQVSSTTRGIAGSACELDADCMSPLLCTTQKCTTAPANSSTGGNLRAGTDSESSSSSSSSGSTASSGTTASNANAERIAAEQAAQRQANAKAAANANAAAKAAANAAAKAAANAAEAAKPALGQTCSLSNLCRAGLHCCAGKCEAASNSNWACAIAKDRIGKVPLGMRCVVAGDCAGGSDGRTGCCPSSDGRTVCKTLVDGSFLSFVKSCPPK